MIEKLLVVNAGSSSMKFRVYKKQDLTILADGICERIGIDGNIKMSWANQKMASASKIANHLDAVDLMLKVLKEKEVITNVKEIIGIGHRVVQGGELFKTSSLVDDKAIAQIAELASLAPLHNPGAVSVLQAFRKITPAAKNVAVFDTSFHQSMVPEYYLYPVPRSWYEEFSVRRYGMHGTSHKYIAQQMAKVLGRTNISIISCHLGNGASLAAIKDGKCVNTSMGLTPLAGVMMGTRSGDIDPAIVEYMVKATGKNVHDITNDLNKASGVLGLSGVSSDMRDVSAAAEKGERNAQEALAIYARKVANYIVQYQNDLENKVDALVFTAGIGENAADVRALIVERLKTLDVNFDDDKNNNRFEEDVVLISKSGAKTPVYVVKTNEELMIAQDLIKVGQL